MSTSTNSSTVHAHPDGDGLRIDVRLVVAPSAGRFRAEPAREVTSEGELVRKGQVIGHICGPGSDDPVVSFCTGFLVRLLAAPGERVRPGQPVAWLHPVDSPSCHRGSAA